MNWFDQFDEFGEIEISRAWKYPIWGFCSIWFKLMKLACLVDWFGHYKLLSIMSNDQFGQFVGFMKLGFSNFGVFDVNSMLKPILWF